MESSSDPRVAWCVVALVLRLHSLPRGMTVQELAAALGVSVVTVSRSRSRFLQTAGLDVAGDRLQGLRL
jgi:predicted DNA-binding transcriptional regulator YafY